MLAAMARDPLSRRALRVLLGSALMVGLVAAAAAVIWSQAVRLGLPYASFTNEAGSSCETTWTGHVCSPLTLADVEAQSGLALPAGTRVEESRLVRTHDTAFTARLLLPAERDGLEDRLQELFGECQDGHPYPLPADWQDQCVRTSNGKRVEGQLPPNTWRVASGRPEGTEELTLDLDIASR